MVETLIYLIGLHFALRGGNSISTDFFVRRVFLLSESTVIYRGEIYLEYTEEFSKISSGCLNNGKTTCKKLHEHTKIPIERGA